MPSSRRPQKHVEALIISEADAQKLKEHDEAVEQLEKEQRRVDGDLRRARLLRRRLESSIRRHSRRI